MGRIHLDKNANGKTILDDILNENVIDDEGKSIESNQIGDHKPIVDDDARESLCDTCGNKGK